MMYKAWRSGMLGLLGFGFAAACGSLPSHQGTANHRQGQGEADANGTAAPRLAEAETDQVLGTLIIPFGASGTALTDSGDGLNHWTVDMQDALPVVGGVAPLKYLKVSGDLHIPTAAADKPYEIGCVYIDMKDNVYYREHTWLRLATSGVKGHSYSDVELPLSINMGSWKTVPVLGDSITLATFPANKVKKSTATVCFKLDFTNAPADEYKGQIIVQYLRPGDTTHPKSCSATSTDSCCQPTTTPPTPYPYPAPAPAPAPTPSTVFACASDSRVLKAGETAALSWANVPAGAALQLSLAADNAAYKGSLGTVVNNGASGATYTAPSQVPTATKIMISAQPRGSEQLPSFCSVSLVADGQIGVPDDGSIMGLPGNVFVLPANTAKIPDFSKIKPLMELIVGNLDVPNHTFTQGFPGVPSLTEWFGIQFKGSLIIPTSQTCSFKLTADDGANLYIDDQLIVNNDGLHPVTDSFGSANLSQGTHKFRVDYYQGPRYYIALQTAWKCGDASSYQIIPSSAFSRPLN